MLTEPHSTISHNSVVPTGPTQVELEFIHARADSIKTQANNVFLCTGAAHALIDLPSYCQHNRK